MKDEMVAWLLTVERFNERDVGNRWPGTEREWRSALWQAKEVLRLAHGIVFKPTRGHAYEFHRASPGEIERRGVGFARKSRRKAKRAEELLRLAASRAAPEEQRRIEELADRQAARNAMASARARLRGEDDPT
jgi:hypothetical protein